MTSRIRLLPAVLTVLALVLGVLALVVVPPGGAPPAEAATRVAKDTCRRIDPNLVNGACLRYRTARDSGLTWIGTYRAPDGRVFFCIDFLYDSRLPRRAERVSTERLVNQLGRRVGDPEVAALNYVISTWAGHGSTGSDDRDAAIALVVREVMGDGVRPGGLTVYPSGLIVGERVRPPAGGLDAAVMRLARSMWREASRLRGPWRLTFQRVGPGPVRLGQVRDYRLSVTSAAGRPVPDARVRFACTGPVTCPRPVVTSRRGAVVQVRPTDVGRFRVVARATGPASDGVLYRQRGWSTHGGATARPAGVQRGWIAQSNTTVAAVAATSRIKQAQPVISTRTSAPVVVPGSSVRDAVTVTGLPPGYVGTVVAELHGPFAAAPGPDDCTSATLAGRVTSRVTSDGTYETPAVVVPAVGHYTWVQRLPRDVDTLPVSTPCGLAEETTEVVPRTPAVATVVSDQRALVGARIFDTVRLSGLAPDDTVELRWRLHGPLAPRRNLSCAGLRWSRAAVAASGQMVVTGSGSFSTPSVLLRAPGCYTYSQEVLASATTTAASSAPGLAVETSLVTRPVTQVVPEVPSGRSTLGRPPRAPVVRSAPDPSPYVPQRRAEPRWLHSDYRAPAGRGARTNGATLTVPRVGVRVAVASVGLDHGAMAVPNRRDRIGWLRTTAAHGDLVGSSVLSGHVSDRPGGLGALRDVRRGDVVRWSAASGTERYEVRAVRRFARTRGLPADLFRTDGRRVVHLVTCTGLRRTPDGRVYFVDNLVVTAVRVG
ncbi:class F sortase [Nocardioides sp.]|uniref:class F sortase n=1 Tax=Nocardioides sp. TaxID=35761 RepID=UPI002725A50E|nr:class F sortase [Nocardioides sp.]MDO9456590.1 class F sortase [Nocardioides sp.]